MLQFKKTVLLTPRFPWLREALLAPFILAAIFWIFFGKFLRGEHSVATWQDNTHFLLPLFSHISGTFAAGEFPYWINSIAGGLPLYNNPQFSLLYPLYFFRWNLFRTPLDTLQYVHYITLLHVAILWVSTYVMLRVFHLRPLASILGATLFAFSANTYAYLFWVNAISPYSWLPLALGSVFLILENKYAKVGLILGWLSIYLLVSASAAQPLIHFIYCTAFLTGSYVILHRRESSRLRVPLRNLLVLALGSLVLSSAVLIPTLLFSRRGMVRFTDAGAVVGSQRIPLAGLLTGQAEPADLAKVLFPLAIPPMTGDPYIGVIPIFLASFALFRRKENWIVVPLLIIGMYALFSSTGTHLGLAYINYWLPLLNKIREPGRYLYVFALASCTLAAFGFEHLTESGPLRELRAHAVTFGSFLILLLLCYWIRQRYELLISDSILLWSFCLFLVLLFASRFILSERLITRVVLAAVAVFPALYYPAPIVKTHEGDYFNETNLHSHRVLQELAKIADIHQYRLVVADDQFSPNFWSMNAAYYDLRTFETFSNPLPLGQVQEMLTAPLLPRYAELLGAKYYLFCGNSSAAPDRYSFEREIEGCKLYSTRDVQSHHFLSTKIGLSYRDVKQFLDRLRSADADLNELSVSSNDTREIADWLGTASVPLGSETSGENQSRNSFNFALKTNRKSVLVLNEYFSGDWQATLNGKPRKLLKVNLNQIGLLLPEGTNQIRFEYRPRLFVGLLYLQKIGFCILAVVFIVMVLNPGSLKSRFHEAGSA